MNYAWIAVIVGNFLPNFGLQRQTPLGLLVMQDYLLPIGWIVAWRAARAARTEHGSLDWGAADAPGGVFGIAVLSSLSIPVRFLYRDTSVLLYSLGKCAKLAAYGGLGLLLSVHVISPRGRRDLAVAAGLSCLLGLFTFVYGVKVLHVGVPVASKSWVAVPNQYSIQLALLAPGLLGYGLAANRTLNERRWVAVALFVGLAATLLSRGRAGLLFGLVVAAGAIRLGAVRAFVAMAVVAAGGLGVTAVSPVAQRELRSLLVERESYSIESEASSEMDDGGRVVTLAHEWPRVKEEPLIGWGFYHRGRRSRLMWTGSHNFWMQMQLELGLAGTALTLAILGRTVGRALALPSSAAIERLTVLLGVAVIVGAGMTGEYYYGCPCLTLALLVPAPAFASRLGHLTERVRRAATAPRPAAVSASQPALRS